MSGGARPTDSWIAELSPSRSSRSANSPDESEVRIESSRTPVTEPNADDGAVASSASGVVHYLAHHGVKAEMRREVADDIDAANLLLSRASDLGADLLVMGGYSRARIAQRVFGGVTRTILETMTVPVLMSH